MDEKVRAVLERCREVIHFVEMPDKRGISPKVVAQTKADIEALLGKPKAVIRLWKHFKGNEVLYEVLNPDGIYTFGKATLREAVQEAASRGWEPVLEPPVGPYPAEKIKLGERDRIRRVLDAVRPIHTSTHSEAFGFRLGVRACLDAIDDNQCLAGSTPDVPPPDPHRAT